MVCVGEPTICLSMFDGLMVEIWLVGWVVGFGQEILGNCNFARWSFGDIWLVGWVVGVSEKQSKGEIR